MPRHHHDRDDDMRCVGPRDGSRDDETDRDRTRAPESDREIDDDNRFSQDHDDHAGRNWHGLVSRYEIDDERGRVDIEDRAGDRDPREDPDGRYRTSAPADPPTWRHARGRTTAIESF